MNQLEAVEKLKIILGSKNETFIEEFIKNKDPDLNFIQFLVQHFSKTSDSSLVEKLMNPQNSNLASVNFLSKQVDSMPENQLFQMLKIYEPFLFTFENKELNEYFSHLFLCLILKNPTDHEDMALR
jgi:hypothetical protein